MMQNTGLWPWLLALGKVNDDAKHWVMALAACHRHLLHHCFQALMDHGARTAFQLTKAYCQRCSVISTSSEDRRLSTIKLGLSLGGFLSDAGWFPESEKVIVSCLKLCEEKDDAKHWVMALAACLVF
ncbi:amyloid protein-binding protein 2-like [Limulus polyphemus]|uniref:Amyloid protein-binding protein 2-like n=1 Tax=Limulus polyphemus TaxID=6850 RepID=A0ABM1RZG3_LIMPO|nr:amyloid protein-binding protein 2-like [Limulus polyphemus]